MGESNVVAMMKQAVELYKLGQVTVEQLQLDPAIAYSSAYGVLRRVICDHIGEIKVRFSDDPAKQGWRQIMGAETPEIIFSVESPGGKFEMPCPVNVLDEWGYLQLLRNRLMLAYKDDVIKQLKRFQGQDANPAQRQLAADSLTLLNYGCAQIVPVLYSLPKPPENLYMVSPDMSMLPDVHWSKDVLQVVFAGFLPVHLTDIGLGGGGALKSWVVALRPFK